MKPEEQNMAIAEWLGVKYHKPTALEINSGSYYQYEPNYCRDLNAIHEAFARLENVQQARFGEELAYILGIEHWTSCKLIIRAVMKATAAQRAEALLRTIGKWHD